MSVCEGFGSLQGSHDPDCVDWWTRLRLENIRIALAVPGRSVVLCDACHDYPLIFLSDGMGVGVMLDIARVLVDRNEPFDNSIIFSGFWNESYE